MNIRTKVPLAMLTGVLCTALYSGSSAAAGNDHARSPAGRRPSAQLTDSQIIGVAEAANVGEVAQGKLAEQKARKQVVKSFANLMVSEHDAQEQKIDSLAKELGVSAQESPLATKIKSDGDAVQRKLNQSASAAFDWVYLNAQIDEHQEVLKAIERLIPSAKSPKLKSLLGDLRDHVAHHLQVAKSDLDNLDQKG